MLIAVTGYKTSGKDTFAKPLVNRGFKVAKFADPLKLMLRTLYESCNIDSDTIDRKLEGDLKDEYCPILNNTPRHAMQTLGTEWRNMVDDQLWVRHWSTRVEQLLHHEENVVCTDLRFLDEAKAIRFFGGKIVRVEADWAKPKQNETHPSELELKEIQEDFLVQNQMGGIYALQQEALRIVA